MGFNVNFGLDSLLPSSTKTSGTQTGTGTKQRVFDQTAIDKLVYDVLSSDRGLASLASGENLSGGFNSSTKTLQTQDFLTKLIGELAVASAPEVTTSEQQSSQTSKKKASVICTELARQGYLSPELYEAGGPPSQQVSRTTWIGYHSWAVGVVPKMEKSPRLCKFLAPIVTSRYRYLMGVPGFHILGRLSVWVGHPICYLIGTVINLRGGYGRANEFA
jgi:hypothetical protein